MKNFNYITLKKIWAIKNLNNITSRKKLGHQKFKLYNIKKKFRPSENLNYITSRK